jgi:hypothetical protein
VAVFYLSLVAILVGTNARRAEEDKEEDEDTGQKCQVSERVKNRKSGHAATVARKCQVNGRLKTIK